MAISMYGQKDTWNVFPDQLIFRDILRKNITLAADQGTVTEGTLLTRKGSLFYPATLKTEDFSGDGSTTKFVLSFPVAYVEEVTIDGTPTTAYKIHPILDGAIIEFDSAPGSGVAIEVKYYPPVWAMLVNEDIDTTGENKPAVALVQGMVNRAKVTPADLPEAVIWDAFDKGLLIVDAKEITVSRG